MPRVPLNFFLAAVLAILMAGCDEETPLTPVRVKLNWEHGVDFIGFYVAQKQGFFDEERLVVTIEPLLTPRETEVVFSKVSSGEYQFSLGGIALVQAQASGLPLVAIANVNKFSPGTLFAKKESGIVTPADLADKRVAVKNPAWREVIEATLKKFDLTLDDIVQIPAGFDMQPFYDGEVDVWAGFINDEAVRARLKGYDIVTLPVHEYGVRTVARTIYITQDIRKNNPDLAERFLRASLRGWNWAITNPEKAIDLLLGMYPELGGEREFHLASFHASIPLLIPPGTEFGEIDCHKWLDNSLLADLPSRDNLCTAEIFEAATKESRQ